MNTAEEDMKALAYAGLMGHEIIGIIGEPGNRRVSCEVNDLDSARRLCSDSTLTVYSVSRTKGGKRRKPMSVYDRRSEAVAAAVKAHNVAKGIGLP